MRAILLFLVTMSLTVTNHTLEKLEAILKSLDYRVRYEKGNFKTGACMLESSKVVVVNKFANLESKIQALVELIRELDIQDQLLDEKQKHLVHTLKQTSLKL
jgi:signal recognition particle subunit SEC65